MKLRMNDFLCVECETKFEQLLDLDDGTDQPVCPNCGNENVEKVISNPGHWRHVTWSQWRVNG